MKKVVIFAGTTEGRKLSDILTEQKVYHTVCVATEYGKVLIEKSPYVQVHAGRMNKDEMTRLLKNNADLVVDATHPYADIVSDNITEASTLNKLQCIRVLRQEEKFTVSDHVRTVDSFADINSLLPELQGNILFTTGSKDLNELVIPEEKKESVYVRVIPSVDSINACHSAGVLAKNIIAMQGPFSTEMNEAIIRQLNISWMVTKESGKAGGFHEKYEAAMNMGISLLVIGRPKDEKGLSVTEAAKIILSGKGITPINSIVSLIGMGMGSMDCVTIEAHHLIEDADLVFGPARLLESVNKSVKYPYYRAKDIIPVIAGNPFVKTVVLYSGDSGFYSGTASFIKDSETLQKEYGLHLNIDIYPGISSVSYMASRLGVSYSDAFITSVHGSMGDQKIFNNLKKKLLACEKSFILVSGPKDVQRICKMLVNESERLCITIGYNLSYDNESLELLTIEEGLNFEKEGLIVVYITNNKANPKMLIPYIEDDEFIRNKTPMTKAVIRHEIVRLLQLHEGDVVYDLGSGTGSVSIEIAGCSPTITVYAVEQNDEACQCMRQNMDKFDSSNIELIKGDAAEIVSTLPIPDAVFIGGSNGKLKCILEGIPKSDKDIRVVVTAVSMETVSELMQLGNEEYIHDFHIKQIAVTDVKKIGSHNLMQAENPVYVCSFII